MDLQVRGVGFLLLEKECALPTKGRRSRGLAGTCSTEKSKGTNEVQGSGSHGRAASTVGHGFHSHRLHHRLQVDRSFYIFRRSRDR